MFVIGGRYTTSCEVFDSCSRMFTKIKSGIKVPDLKEWYFDAVCIGNYIIVFHSFMFRTETIIYLYDVFGNKWSTIKFDFTKNLIYSNFVKYYAQK